MGFLDDMLKDWHRVPAGATIPAGTPYAARSDDGRAASVSERSLRPIRVPDRGTYLTREPIAPPDPLVGLFTTALRNGNPSGEDLARMAREFLRAESILGPDEIPDGDVVALVDSGGEVYAADGGAWTWAHGEGSMHLSNLRQFAPLRKVTR